MPFCWFDSFVDAEALRVMKGESLLTLLIGVMAYAYVDGTGPDRELWSLIV